LGNEFQRQGDQFQQQHQQESANVKAEEADGMPEQSEAIPLPDRQPDSEHPGERFDGAGSRPHNAPVYTDIPTPFGDFQRMRDTLPQLRPRPRVDLARGRPKVVSDDTFGTDPEDDDQDDDTAARLPAAFLRGMRLEPFSGDRRSDDVAEWLESFEAHAQATGVPDSNMAPALLYYLRGSAANWARSLPARTKSSYFRLVYALKEEYETSNVNTRANLVGQQFQGDKEDVAQFVRRLRYIVNRAHPEANEITKDSIMKSQLLAGVRPEYVAAMPSAANSKSLKDMREAFMSVEVAQQLQEARQGRSMVRVPKRTQGAHPSPSGRPKQDRKVTWNVNEVEVQADAGIKALSSEDWDEMRKLLRADKADLTNVLQDMQHQSMSQFQDMQARLRSLECKGQPAPRYYENNRGVVRCWQCGRPGHTRQQCKDFQRRFGPPPTDRQSATVNQAGVDLSEDPEVVYEMNVLTMEGADGDAEETVQPAPQRAGLAVFGAQVSQWCLFVVMMAIFFGALPIGAAEPTYYLGSVGNISNDVRDGQQRIHLRMIEREKALAAKDRRRFMNMDFTSTWAEGASEPHGREPRKSEKPMLQELFGQDKPTLGAVANLALGAVAVPEGLAVVSSAKVYFPLIMNIPLPQWQPVNLRHTDWQEACKGLGDTCRRILDPYHAQQDCPGTNIIQAAYAEVVEEIKETYQGAANPELYIKLLEGFCQADHSLCTGTRSDTPERQKRAVFTTIAIVAGIAIGLTGLGFGAAHAKNIKDLAGQIGAISQAMEQTTKVMHNFRKGFVEVRKNQHDSMTT
jgi:hypothetical protein